jgi:hypothetical protein
MIRLLAVVLLTIAGLAGQAVPVCSAVSEEDARSILGLSAKRTNDPSGCQWQEVGHKKQFNVAIVGVASMFERARAASAKKGTSKAETGLGGTAFSAIPSADKGARAAIYLLKGSAVLVVDIEGFEPGGAEVHLPQVRDLVRKLAGKL